LSATQPAKGAQANVVVAACKCSGIVGLGTFALAGMKSRVRRAPTGWKGGLNPGIYIGHHIGCAPKPGAKIRSAAGITGYNLLKAADRELIASILFDEASNESAPQDKGKEPDNDEPDMMPTQSIDVVRAKAVFIMPVPGQNGAKAGRLGGKSVVLTGIFPEAGYVGKCSALM
jgi:hypothetical protein